MPIVMILQNIAPIADADIQSAPDGALLLSGDMQAGSPSDDVLLLSGDQSAGSPNEDAELTSVRI